MHPYRTPKYLIVISVLIVAILAFSCQNCRSIWQPDEGYYSAIAKSMIKHNTLVIPYLGNDEIFLDKPPLLYWGIIAGLKSIGYCETGFRAFNSLTFFLTCIMTGILAARMFRSNKIGIFAALIYATMTMPFSASNFVTPDTPLTLWTTAAMFCFWMSVENNNKAPLWQLLLYAMLGLGFLTKGPAVLIPCGGMFVFLLLSRHIKHFFLTWWTIPCLLLFMAIGLSWYIWVSISLDGAFGYMFKSQIWGRLVSNEFRRNPGFSGMFIYLPIILFGTFPWTTVFIEKYRIFKTTFSNKSAWAKLLNHRPKLMLICWFFVPMIILCLASSRLGLYALPTFPAIAIACAKVWAEKLTGACPANLAAFLSEYRKPVIWLSIWCTLLLCSRIIMPFVSEKNDMKVLAAELTEYLPDQKIEICPIDKRTDGLLFYLNNNIDFTTCSKEQYPTYTSADTILSKISYKTNNTDLVFLVSDNRTLNRVSDILRKNNSKFRIMPLTNNRTLIFPELPYNQHNISRLNQS